MVNINDCVFCIIMYLITMDKCSDISFYTYIMRAGDLGFRHMYTRGTKTIQRSIRQIWRTEELLEKQKVIYKISKLKMF